MSDLKECKIIDTINVEKSKSIIQTPCGKFLIGIEKHSIYKYCLETKQKFRIAGSVEQRDYQDGTRDESRFFSPTSLTLSKDLKTLFIAEPWNGVIRAICVGTGITTTFSGQVDKFKQVNGPKEKACFYLPSTLKLSPDGNTLYVGDYFNLRTICIETGQVNTIGSFGNEIRDFSFSPDGKHIIICHWTQVLKYNLETRKSEIILQGDGFVRCEISKYGQFLFISKVTDQKICIVNLVTNGIIGTINEPSNFEKLKISTNFKTFTQSQLSKHSFLFQAVVKRISI